MSANGKRTGTLPAALALIAALAALAAALFSWMGAADRNRVPDRLEISRESIAALEARELWLDAVKELEYLRREPGLSRAEQANVLYKMAALSDRYLKDCPRALSWYTQAKALAPNAQWAAEADKRSIVCMESLGRKTDAQALLNQLTGGEGGGTGPVVAVIDGRSVRWDEVQAAMALSVPSADLQKPEVRQKLLGQFVYTYLLAAEAVKKGLDSDEQLKQAAEQSRRDSLAALYLRRELGDAADQEKQRALADQLIQLHSVRFFNEAIPKP